MSLGPGTTRLRLRITLAITLVVVLFVVVQGYLAYSALAEHEDGLVDRVVEVETQRLVDRAAAGDEVLPKDGTPVDVSSRVRAWLQPIHPLVSSAAAQRLPERVRMLSEGSHVWKEDGREIHYLVTRTPDGRLVVEYDASEDEAFVYTFGVYLLATGLAFSLLAAAVAIGLARIIVEPFTRLAMHMSRWSPGQRAAPVGRTDEESLLLEAFESAQRRLDEANARTREFAANVRHEIRTPLTALRTDAELLILTEEVGEDGRERLQRMQTTIDAIAADIESLHNLSKARTAEPEAVVLAVCVEDVWAGLQHRNVGGRLVMLNRVDSADVIEIDRLGLMTVLQNLLRNAIDHAAPDTCIVERVPGGMTLTDDGPGIEAEHLPRIFDRYFSRRRSDVVSAPVPEARPDERGLGLAIAKQTATAHDWTLDVESRLGEGTRFILLFNSSSVV